MRLIDLSHRIDDGLVTYPGLPGPVISDFLSRRASRARYDDAEFHIADIHMIANTGTYIDAPFHRYESGAHIADLPLRQLVFVDAVLVTATDLTAIGPERLPEISLDGKAVLFRTDWSRHWKTPAYGIGNPFITRLTAETLVQRRAAIVGIDSLNLDDATQKRRPAHTALLGAGIPIVEHLCNLHQLPAEGFTFSAVPAPFVGVGTFPVRAFAALED